jgi:starch phosphorylase
MTDMKTFIGLPERIEGLRELASNLWWVWRPGARMLFKILSRQASQESRQSPNKMLCELAPDIFVAAASDSEHLQNYYAEALAQIA